MYNDRRTIDLLMRPVLYLHIVRRTDGRVGTGGGEATNSSHCNLQCTFTPHLLHPLHHTDPPHPDPQTHSLDKLFAAPSGHALRATPFDRERSPKYKGVFNTVFRCF